MATVAVPMAVPEELAPYLTSSGAKAVFVRNAMLVYPFIQDLTISHGRAAEVLGVTKAELIDFYDSIGIPYLNQPREELLRDIDTLDRVFGIDR